MFSVLPAVVVVYLPKPSSVTTWSRRASSETSVPLIVAPRPSWGIGLPVSWIEMNTAGMM
ncbi:MAG: hypothetical protein AW08_01248 [Candidatus Accumulibacter adjunctus]|uniref:Uncharacterized protein n=1 Tax=Candidatus Accumulibacter adjunctus TaxID=1454001 RepID=A0A011N0W8_9PROT|nr:MAG: hypothetical protein AW08_01248 [Candidatus Accumulibacter adjunctus]